MSQNVHSPYLSGSNSLIALHNLTMDKVQYLSIGDEWSEALRALFMDY